jgi:hypothetical protein
MKPHSTSVAWWTDTMYISSVRCPVSKCTARFSSLTQLWLVIHFRTSWKTDCYPNWIPIMMITFYNWTELHPIFTRMYECFSIVFFHSTGLDVLQMETTTLSLGHPIRQIIHHVISFRQRLCVTIAHAHPETSWSDNACAAGHYSGHAILSLGWVWLPGGCVSCDPRCTHWRIVINAWEGWIVSIADSVCCAHVKWEIHFY